MAGRAEEHLLPATVTALRDRAMLHLAFAAGLRVSELIGLRLDQFERGQAPCIHAFASCGLVRLARKRRYNSDDGLGQLAPA